MQDVRAVGSGRLFVPGAGVGDRRLRHHNHPAPPALKCPRCDSFNTKFCYYNNYNLSQPRHFCKACRRYWTKGGVLRNVPVGGGCRKAKRSSKKQQQQQQKKSAEREVHAPRTSTSTDESSSSLLTASTKEKSNDLYPSTTTTATVVSDFSDSRYVNPNFDYPVSNPSSDGQIFANLTTTEFGIANIPTTSYGREQKESRDPGPKDQLPADGMLLMEEMNTKGVTTTTAEVLELDWSGGADGGGGCGRDDEELFDLTAAVDPAYWGHPQWTDGGDHSLNFLP